MAKQLCLWVLMGALILNVACRKNPVENSAIIEKYFDQCFAAYEAGNNDAAMQYAQLLYEPIVALAKGAEPDEKLAYKLFDLNYVVLREFL